jgi:RNA-directed DNA polymerase
MTASGSPRRKVLGPETAMHVGEKSDSVIVPEKSPNRANGRGGDGGKDAGQGECGREKRAPDTAAGTSAPSDLVRIRHVSRTDKTAKFTALMHHVYDIERLRQAYLSLERKAAAGIDGVTWRSYGEDLEARLLDLSDRLKRGAYRAMPVRRAWVPKTDGRLRPLGVPTLEEKLVQTAVVEVLNAIYEPEFLDFSYGFRPGRSQHQALDALAAGIHIKKVGWVLDLDIRDFFGTMKHEWIVRFVERRIADQRIVRLIRKWLSAGVLEDGKRRRSTEGTVQGGSVSPVLANIYLHYVMDLWVQQWRKREAIGDVIVIRYADDSVLGFEWRSDAEKFQKELAERLAKFGLSLHPEKTRLLEFGRFAALNRERKCEGRPETFQFLGFTHISGRTATGRFTVTRLTARPRLIAKLKAVKAELRRRHNAKLPEIGRYLRSVLIGHYRYYGVPFNLKALKCFHRHVGILWKAFLERRSQRTRVSWERMNRLIDKWLPRPITCHPYPLERFSVTTQGRSRMR